MNWIDHVCATTAEYIEQMPKSQRKEHGQFFTSKDTAVFMASLFTIQRENNSIRVLDPGAGSGILSVAILERLEKIEEVKIVELVCYETDPNIFDLLKSNLEWVCSQSTKKITYRIVTENYIVSQLPEYNSFLGFDPEINKFDIVIGNPPYKKIAKKAPEAQAMPNICYGAPNLYFLFAAMSIFNLKYSGEMVYIIPRSWTSGAYFKQFRKYLFDQCALEHIHLFISRDKVFEKESVLQETIIIKLKKTQIIPNKITITTTQSNADFSTQTIFEAPYSTVVSKRSFYVYLVTNSEDIKTLNSLHRWKDTLPNLGLQMKTGLTVDFRHRMALRRFAENDAVPLFYSQHIHEGNIVFPVGKEYEYILTEKKSLLQENTNYLFMKRFTAKEEHRRLQCGIYLAREHPNFAKISTQNKINFICGRNALSEKDVYGLYVLFNSTLYDRYYRILNGSTQVNSTEVNNIPVPPIKVIEAMGEDLMRRHDMSESSCDSILRRYI